MNKEDWLAEAIRGKIKGKKPICLTLSPETIEKLDKLAIDRNRKRSQIVELLLNHEMDELMKATTE